MHVIFESIPVFVAWSSTGLNRISGGDAAIRLSGDPSGAGCALTEFEFVTSSGGLKSGSNSGGESPPSTAGCAAGCSAGVRCC